MSETLIPTETMTVGPHVIDVILNLAGGYVLYLDVGGAAKQVLRVESTTNAFTIVVTTATVPTFNLNWTIKVLPNYLKHGEKFTIYGVIPTAAATGKLTATEVSA